MGNDRQLPILSVVTTGSAEYPRYWISDEQERQWTGERFAEVGVLYPTHHAAAVDLHQILTNHFVGTQSVKYVVPLVVEVYSDEPLHISQVAMYLSNCARLQLNTPEHGNGPGSSLVLPRIEWHRMIEQKGRPKNE